MLSRVVTALVGIPVLVLVVASDLPWGFPAFVLLVTTAALHEYYAIVFRARGRAAAWATLLGTVTALGVVIPGTPLQALAFLALILGAAAGAVLAWGWGGRKSHLVWAALGFFYVGYLFPHLVLLHRFENGKAWVFFVLLVVMTADTAGYFVGTWLGKTKLAPTISPNKTMEGAAAQVLGGTLAGFLAARVLLPAISSAEASALALVLTWLGLGGDLFESWFKRTFAVKDSGSLLPGHGGLLDRIDSLIFSAVFMTYYVGILHS